MKRWLLLALLLGSTVALAGAARAQDEEPTFLDGQYFLVFQAR